MKFAKIWLNTCEMNSNLPKNQNLATFTDNSVIFKKLFCTIKKIWVNLKFNKLNDVVFEKYLHRSAQNSF
jgi:hypothetical protein